MELMAIQIFLIIVAAIILAYLYWQDYKSSKDSLDTKPDILPAQRARASRRLLRKRRYAA
jgi:hypothetical protein